MTIRGSSQGATTTGHNSTMGRLPGASAYGDSSIGPTSSRKGMTLGSVKHLNLGATQKNLIPIAEESTQRSIQPSQKAESY